MPTIEQIQSLARTCFLPVILSVLGVFRNGACFICFHALTKRRLKLSCCSQPHAGWLHVLCGQQTEFSAVRQSPGEMEFGITEPSSWQDILEVREVSWHSTQRRGPWPTLDQWWCPGQQSLYLPPPGSICVCLLPQA